MVNIYLSHFVLDLINKIQIIPRLNILITILAKSNTTSNRNHYHKHLENHHSHGGGHDDRQVVVNVINNSNKASICIVDWVSVCPIRGFTGFLRSYVPIILWTFLINDQKKIENEFNRGVNFFTTCPR